MKYAARSDVGKVRSQNEDAWSVIQGPSGNPAGFAVADGMGGHEAGEVASRMAIESVTEAIGRCAAVTPSWSAFPITSEDRWCWNC